jgi:hypothetical protein
MRLKSSLIAAIAVITPVFPAIGQFWNQTQPTQQAPSNNDAPPAPSPAFIQPKTDFTVGQLRSTPPSGPATSLGGSGATGLDSVGTLPERDTGFDLNTWRDTPFGSALSLIDALPGRIDSEAEHQLARNLLVSIADAPRGDDGSGRMLEKRVLKLLALGNIDDAAALARAAPVLPQSPALAQAEIQSELLAGQVEAACIDLRAFASLLTDPVSANALLLCRQRAGETIEGGIPPIDVESLGIYAIIAGAPVSFDAARSPPAIAVAAARDVKIAPERRLEAAFAAGRASAIYGETLVDIFHATPPATAAETQDGPPVDGAGAAALFQAIDRADDINVKLAMAERGLLSPGGVSDKIGVAMAAPLRNLQPVPELEPLAARLAIVFYTQGDADAASPWADLAVSSGGGAALWPYRILLKQADPIGIADWERQSGLDAAHSARIRLILSAFGVTTPPANAARIAGDNQREPAFADLLAIDASAGAGRIGETTLRAIALLGRGGPATAHPLALSRALAGLEAVHLHNEARALAFEAITASLFKH